MHPSNRWHNYLKPNIRKDAWRPEEDKLILDYHHSFCNKWSKIAEYLPGRCVNSTCPSYTGWHLLASRFVSFVRM